MAYDFSKFKKQITGVEEWLKREFSGIRTGQASPALLDGVKVESYGTSVPLSQVAGVTTEGSRTIRVTPWDASQVKEVMGLFSFEESKLEFAKFAYDRTTDKNNYYIVNDAFDFEASIEALDNYIKSK